MDRSTFLGQINSITNNLIIGLAASTLLVDKKARVYLDTGWIELGKTRITFQGLREWMSKNEQIIGKHAINQFRLAIGDVYETLTMYAGHTNQIQKLKVQNWYNFVYRIRCTFFHGGKIGVRNKSEEASWNGAEIKMSMNGEYLSFDILPPEKAWELYFLIENFSKSLK